MVCQLQGCRVVSYHMTAMRPWIRPQFKIVDLYHTEYGLERLQNPCRGSIRVCKRLTLARFWMVIGKPHVLRTKLDRFWSFDVQLDQMR